MDCPYYEQQQYRFDSSVRLVVVSGMTGDRRLTRKCIDEFERLQTPNGLLLSIAPSSCVYQMIPGYSLMRIMMLKDYLDTTAGLAFTGEYVGMMEVILNYSAKEVNISNRGPIPNLPVGEVVETNTTFRADSVVPVMAGEIHKETYPLVAGICGEQERLDAAFAHRDVKAIFNIFAKDPPVTCGFDDAKALFKEICLNTEEYLESYDLSELDRL